MSKRYKNNSNITLYLFNRRFLRKLRYYYVDFPRMFRCEAIFNDHQCGLYVKHDKNALNKDFILCDKHRQSELMRNRYIHTNYKIPNFTKGIHKEQRTFKTRLDNSCGISKNNKFKNISNKMRIIKSRNPSFRWYLKQTEEYKQTMDENIHTNTKILRMLELNCHMMQYMEDKFNDIDRKINRLEDIVAKLKPPEPVRMYYDIMRSGRKNVV